MGLRIATNVQSLAAQRNLGITNGAQKASLEKMASGARITRAADDAAGLAISDRMRSQVRSIRQDVRNANDGISMIQTAEGGMNEIGNILVRFRELSIQAASDTISDTERGFIDKEVQQLHSEVDRISKSTEFNGHKLLNGEGENLEIQVGVGNDIALDRFQYDPSKTNVTTEHLGIGTMSVKDKVSAQNNLTAIDTAISTLSANRAEMGALQNRLQATVANLNIYDENLSAARSRIYDVDMASETAELTKQNILSQAGTSVLSQANQNNTLALKLIG
ncbi:MAG TPA: flagellin FliC [Bdellovibrionales bacterium]|nr:MAG: flagellin [Bdellovibrionales bacterium GWB1_52_6]OFZ05271.1 MAG: flagellin [Bdellovibrionales bacterium GWA1_52_35]OFZ42797.1 MAG: flagellin [Bdellovibrionales bacterium GWC1_52_8]HAR41118.1 flagellin FliC [Bdellovibrionales bacterium]HCM38591.1 flagellin FliC [Bdellovibrionales bacterium]